MMSVFPSYAELLISGYGEKRESVLLRTEMESGPPKQARIKSRVMVERAVAIRLMSLADYQAFVAWFALDLDEGAGWFDFNDPVSGVSKPARFVGGGLEATPTTARLNGWTINAKIETWG